MKEDTDKGKIFKTYLSWTPKTESIIKTYTIFTIYSLLIGCISFSKNQCMHASVEPV